MDQVIKAGQRSGNIKALASKSQAHRQVICAALSENDAVIICDGMSKDIEATIGCMRALGAQITVNGSGISVSPVKTGCKEEPLHKGEFCSLPCGESGSTLRFLVPVAGALGRSVVFHMEGRLPSRPMGEFTEELAAHGMKIRQENELLFCEGKLLPGQYTIPGNISSQYISGLLMALPLLDGDSTICITKGLESQNYITMTEDVIRSAGITIEKEIPEDKDVFLQYTIPGSQKYRFPACAETERDWSNATFFLCMGALSETGITVEGLSLHSSQGDKEVIEILKKFGADVENHADGRITVRKQRLEGITVNAARIPDMVPALSAVASVAKGITRITHAERLRMKESDRLQTVRRMLSALGADITETEDGLVINGKETLAGGTIDAAGDHRIAMAAAVAATVCEGEVTVCGSECVSKSYPGFWEDLEKLERME